MGRSKGKDKFVREVFEMVEDLREAIKGMLDEHESVDGLVFATAIVSVTGYLVGGALKKAGCPEDDLASSLTQLRKLFGNYAKRSYEEVESPGSARGFDVGDVGEGGEVHTLVMGAIDRTKRKMEIDPRFWEDLAKAPPEVQAEVKKIIAAMQQAAETLPADCPREDFEAEVERLCGKRPEQIDNLEPEIEKLIRERAEKPATRH